MAAVTANVMMTEQWKLEERAEGGKRPEVRMSGGGGGGGGGGSGGGERDDN